MQISFWKLKHYRLDSDEGTDAKENHATECLAACLRFSPAIKRAFLEFLWQDQNTAWLADAEVLKTVTVRTQQRIDARYFLDLVLQSVGRFIIVVEIKVGSKEDGDQLDRYAGWLANQKEPAKLFFSLVQKPNPQLEFKKHGVQDRFTWLQLHRWLDRLPLSTLSATDVNLIRDFCGYLENEGIVMPYQLTDLKKASQALKTIAAIRGIFSEVKQRLEKTQALDIKIEHDLKPDSWPAIRIGKPEWEKRFGGGNVRKANVWFTIPGIWDAEKHGFWCDIDLWNKGHNNSWELVKPKLDGWFHTLKSWEVYKDNWDTSMSDVPPHQITSPPLRILIPHFPKVKSLENEDEWSAMSEEKLVSCLVEEARRMISKVDELRP